MHNTHHTPRFFFFFLVIGKCSNLKLYNCCKLLTFTQKKIEEPLSINDKFGVVGYEG